MNYIKPCKQCGTKFKTKPSITEWGNAKLCDACKASSQKRNSKRYQEKNKEKIKVRNRERWANMTKEQKEEQSRLNKEYRLQNKERIRAKRKEYYWENREEISVRRMEKSEDYREGQRKQFRKPCTFCGMVYETLHTLQSWRRSAYCPDCRENMGTVHYQKYKEKASAYYKKYYVKNKTKINKRNKQYRKDHPELFRKYSREYYQKNRQLVVEKMRERARSK